MVSEDGLAREVVFFGLELLQSTENERRRRHDHHKQGEEGGDLRVLPGLGVLREVPQLGQKNFN